MIDLESFKALTFDCYGTLIDWEAGIAAVVSPWLDGLSPPVPVDLVISAFAIMQAKHQQARPALLYTDVLARAWTDVEHTFGWPADASRGIAFASSVGSWPPFADTVAALRYLEQHYRLAILSNVDNASLARTLTRLEVPFDLTVTAEDVGSYKPGLPHFERAFAKFAEMGISKREILHVAQSKHHDIAPARQLGLTCAWVNRRHGKKGSGATLAADARPDLSVVSLAELVAMHRG